MDALVPTVAELEANTVVRAAVEAAWVDSLPADPQRRHEEGGWIYLDPMTGDCRGACASGCSVGDQPEQPAGEGRMLRGREFHTHPNPAAEGWATGPSAGDIRADDSHGVPDLIRAENRIHYSGPERRRGGLGGNPGYPA